MLSSEYRDPFSLVETTYEVNEWGDQAPVDRTVYEGWCKATNLSGREYWEAFEQKMESTMKFHCRWYPLFEEIDTKSVSLVFRGVRHDILSIDNVESGNADCTIKAKAVG